MHKISPQKGGGINRVVRSRSKALAERGFDISILTLADFDSKKVKARLRETGRLDRRVGFLNIYDYYQAENTKTDMTKKQKIHYAKVSEVDEDGYQVQMNDSGSKTYYMSGGKRLKRKKWRPSGTLESIHFYNENKEITVSEKYHPDGYLKKKKHYEPTIKDPIQIRYFTRDGFCFLDKQQDQSTLFFRNAVKTKTFGSETELHAYWLDTLCHREAEKPFVICDKLHYAPSIIKMKDSIAHKIYPIHSNHLEKPYGKNSPLRSSKKVVFDNLKKEDCVVVLTEKQKQHIIQKKPEIRNNIYVIPHHTHQISTKDVEKDDKTVSLVARLVKTKQIDHAIDAFQQVIKKVPDAKLEIYGTGDMEATLRQQIKRLQLNQNVFLKGYAENIDEVYQRSLISLLTSRSEAFSMVILESMINGTPTISYDINYGPSDIITDKKDGFLIPQDKHTLAAKIIKLLKNPRKARKMGERGKSNVTERYNELAIMEKWIKLFNHIKEKQ